MLRSLIPALRTGETGQALVLYTFALVALLGLVAMSIDVGRLVWARTQIQAAVDSAALAAAGGMPSTTTATANANYYWTDNSGFIRSQGNNVVFNVSFPANSNQGVQVHGEADIPTWFARIFGIDHWHVSADGSAAAQYLDVAMVLDVSGSTCWGSYAPVSETAAQGPFGSFMGPGRVADQVKLTVAMPTGTAASYLITVNSTAIFNSTTASQNNAKFGYNTTSRYYQYNPGSPDVAGIIKIDNEVMQITAINSATTMTVKRAQANSFTGASGAQQAHAVNALIYSHHANCGLSAPAATGPFDYADTIVSDAQAFIGMFNSSYDHFGLVKFSSTGANISGLTSNFGSLYTSLAAFGAPGGGTNAPHGIAVGRMVIDGAGARAGATRVLVFLTDGMANMYCGNSGYSSSNYNSATSCSGPYGSDTASDRSRSSNDAYAEAQRLVNELPGRSTLIYTIGLGPYADSTFLTQIAAYGHGQYFYAPTPADLSAAFVSVAQSAHISLTQ